jgi:hypothetical protein
MSGAAGALNAALLAALSSDLAVLAVLGGEKVFDRPAGATEFPYVTLGPASHHDLSTGDEDAFEHFVTVHAWSKGRGRGEALAMVEAVRRCLDGTQLELAGHALVFLRCEHVEVGFVEPARAFRGVVRLRALTEALN